MVKIVETAKAPTEILGGTRRIKLIGGQGDAGKFGVLLIEVKPNSPPHVKYHFHKKKESAFFIITGKAKMIIEGKEYLVNADTIVLVPPGERHVIMNAGDTELKIVEIYSPPMLYEDNYTVDGQS